MRYIYLPKLLKDLENLEQYNTALGALASNGRFENVSIDQFLEAKQYRNSYCVGSFGFTFTGNYTRYYLAPRIIDGRIQYSSEACIQYSEEHDTIFYVYSSSGTHLAVQEAVQDIFRFIISVIQEAYTCTPEPAYMTSISSQQIAEATLAVLKQLVKDYDSEEAFRNDILKDYPFALTKNPFVFATINNNLNNTKELAKAIYTAPDNRGNWNKCQVNAFGCKLLNVLNEIDFWVDSADYDRLCAYEYLLRDEFTRNNKQLEYVNEVQKNTFFDYRSHIRERIIKAKQAYSQGRKITMKLDELQLTNVKPKNIKLHLQW